MNPCECRCGGLAKKRFIHGHYGRTQKNIHGHYGRTQKKSRIVEQAFTAGDFKPLTSTFNQVEVLPEGPPMHPLPINHARWRLADERPGTDPRLPWIETKCHECLETMWTRDPLSTWQNGGICEECLYLRREDLIESCRKQYRQMARAPWNPFDT